MTMTRILQIATVAMLLPLVIAGCPQEAPEEFTLVEDPDAIHEDDAAEPLEEAEPRDAPDFTVQLAGDGEASLSDYEGRILVLDFWATWCTACVKELPDYQELYDRWDRDEVDYLGMSLDSDMAVIEGFLSGRDDLTLPMALTPEETVEAYLGSRRTLPSSRVIDGEGVIRYEFMGPASERVERAVEALLKEAGAGVDDAD